MKLCTFSGCDRSLSCKGLCASHYQQQWRGLGLSPLKEYNIRKDEVCYQRAHQRLRDDRGAAREYGCAKCGTQAAEWAYDYCCPKELKSAYGFYSSDPSHYHPLCVLCHRQFDRSRREMARV